MLLTTPYVLGIDDSPGKNLLRQVAARRETLEGTLSNFTGARARGWLFHPADGNDDILIVRPKTKLTSIAATYTRVLGAEVEDLAGPRIELGTGTWLGHPLLGAGSPYQVVLDSWRVTAAWAGNRGTCWFGHQHEAPILLDNDQHDLPAVCSGSQELGHGGSPRLPR
jgi:hypothetical protein